MKDIVDLHAVFHVRQGETLEEDRIKEKLAYTLGRMIATEYQNYPITFRYTAMFCCPEYGNDHTASMNLISERRLQELLAKEKFFDENLASKFIDTSGVEERRF